MKFLLPYKFVFIGMITGAVAGYAYYHFIGCAAGTCPITSKPLNSILYGAMTGGILFSSFKKSVRHSGEEKPNQEQNKNQEQ